MKNYLLSFMLLFLVQLAFAQPPQSFQKTKTGIGKISGIVLDNESREPIEFATISLYLQAENKLVSGAVADEKGKFSIEQLVDGDYKLEISFIGYVPKMVANVKVEKERNVNLGKILIIGSAIQVDEVTVTGQRSLIEEKVDRTVYNAEQDDLAKGGDAADVLRKVPLLQVDLEGNVSLRGSSNIQVLINNKPSTILASSVADAMKMIPAEEIKKVEVITSPSAKYDAQGSGGIINIITKRNNLEGYYLNVRTAAGLRASNLSLNGSLRKGKFGMTLGGFGRASYNPSEGNMEQTTIVNGLANVTDQTFEGFDNGVFGRYNLGMDYDIDNTQFLSGGIRFGIRNSLRDQLQTTEIYSDDVLQSTFFRNIDGTNTSNSYDINLDYLKKFDEDKEFSISTLYNRNNMNDNFTSDNLDAEENIINSLKNINDNVNEEFTVQTDFESPISDNQRIEVGAKGIFRNVNSEFAYFFADNSLDYQPSTLQPSGILDYQQNVTAAYTSYTYSTKSKFTIKAGARYERTSIEATQDGENIDIPNYDNLVPSLNFAKTFKNFATVKLGYNRRIQRPWLRQLNPNVNVSNSQNISVGNPNLQPELTDNIELGFSKLIKKTYINISTFGRLTDNAINTIRYPIDSIQGAILTTFENIGRQRAIGMNVFANVNITSNWSLNGGFSADYAVLEGQIVGLDGVSETAQNSGINYSGRLMTQMKLNDGWSMQAFTFLRGRRIQLQGSTGGFGVYAIGMNKDFKNKKGSFGIAVENFANRGWNIRTELESPRFTQVNNNLLINRSIRVNFSYRFGQVNFQGNKRKTKSVRNDDLMGGGGDGGNMNGGMTGGQPRTSRASTKKSTKKKKSTPVTPAAKNVDINGKWKGVSESPMGSFEQTFTFKVEGTTLSGTIETPMGSQEFTDGKIEDGKFSFDISFGGYTMTQNGTIVDENKIILENSRGEVELTRVQ